MATYLALLRGINVGGNVLIKMADLKAALTGEGFAEVRTYIQSGNVIFESNEKDKAKLAQEISKVIKDSFSLNVDVVVFSKAEWEAVIKAAPKSWGKDPDWRHNLLIMIGDHDSKEVVAAIGELKPDIEIAMPGKSVVYQSASIKDIGRTRYSRLPGLPIYKNMTIRNFNTATNLLGLISS